MPGTRDGRDVAAWSGRRRQQALEDVRHWYGPRGRLAGPGNERTGAPCIICQQPINYTFRRTEDSLSVQHMKSRRDYPELTWEPTNWKPAHLRCNVMAGAGDRPHLNAPSLGLMSG